VQMVDDRAVQEGIVSKHTGFMRSKRTDRTLKTNSDSNFRRRRLMDLRRGIAFSGGGTS